MRKRTAIEEVTHPFRVVMRTRPSKRRETDHQTVTATPLSIDLVLSLTRAVARVYICVYCQRLALYPFAAMPSSSSLPVSSVVYSSAVRRVLLLALLVFAVSLDTTQAQNPTASPSLAPSTSAAPTIMGFGECVDIAPDSGGRSSKVTIGDETNVCLQLGNGGNWAAGGVDYIHFTSQPKADANTRFHVPLCT
jgi:hypothetical protein